MLASSNRYESEAFRPLPFQATPDPASSHQGIGELLYYAPGYTRLKEYLLSDSSKPHSTWKTCEHYKCSPVSGSGTGFIVGRIDYADGGSNPMHQFAIDSPDALYKGEYGTCCEFNNGLTPYYVSRLDGGFVPPPGNLDELIGYALSRILPKIKAELSLINSLIELKDIVTLRSTIERAGSFFRRLVSRPNVPLHRLFRTNADIYLQYKFNIAPLLSDITGIYRVFAGAERRLNDLITRSGCVRTSHFSKVLTESPNSSEDPITTAGFSATRESGGSYLIYSTTVQERFVQTDPATFHVQVQYNYNYTAYQLEHARLLSILDGLGVNFNPKILWNAIPWSFVADWVFGIGQYLDQFGRLNMAPKINILQCLWSLSRRRRITVQGYSNSQTITGAPGELMTRSHFVRPVVVETAYRRQTFTPSFSLITSSGLTPTEISLGAALVISRRRRPKRLKL